MKRPSKQVSRNEAERCSSCGSPVAGYESVSFSSKEKGERLLCWRCFNTEMAKEDGLSGFEHLDFDPMEVFDCEGAPHEFHFRMRLLGGRVALDALELRDGAPAGYQFQIIGDADGNLLVLLSRLMERIRRAMTFKHLGRGELGLHIAGDVVRGRIECDVEDERRVPLVVVDGREVTWEQFGWMMMSFEGWHFKLKILDPSEEA